jgi:hypothetical protein
MSAVSQKENENERVINRRDPSKYLPKNLHLSKFSLASSMVIIDICSSSNRIDSKPLTKMTTMMMVVKRELGNP